MTCGFAACDCGHRCHHKHRHEERRCKVSSYSDRALLPGYRVATDPLAKVARRFRNLLLSGDYMERPTG